MAHVGALNTQVSQAIWENPAKEIRDVGGFGSGRHATRATVEGCRSILLDINEAIRFAKTFPTRLVGGEVMTVGSSRVMWTTVGQEQPWAAATLTLMLAEEHGHARLTFDISHASCRTGPQDQLVHLESTPCRFGGRRWWWICPASGRRCAKLYLPNGSKLFLSRGPGAYRLAYASENSGALNRSHGRLARLHRRMGDHYKRLADTQPIRPKWMRHKTYARLTAEWEAAMEQHDEIFLLGAKRWLRFR